MSAIFIQIASYRDPELIPTLDSLFNNAKNPNNINIGLVWQKDETESIGKYYNDSRLRIIEIPYQEAKGVCWARNLCQSLYRGETYTLQLDSHHRFTKDWDVTLIKMIKDLQKKGHKKPLLTSYLPSYDPKTEEKVNIPWRLEFMRFLPEGPAFPSPGYIDNYKELKEPLQSRFYSAHFTFTLGQFCTEVPHDPNLYFHGEEPSIAARAYTWGYHLFHPHKVVAWHEYTRNGKPKHWDDCPWADNNNQSYKRYRKLFSIKEEKYDEKEFGRYGLGKIRTLDEYKAYSGVDLSGMKVQQHVLDHILPPNTEVYQTDEEYEQSFVSLQKHVIHIHKDEVDPTIDYDFWVIAFKDKKGNDLVRLDADEAEVQNILKGNKEGEWYLIWRDWYGDQVPDNWTVWPHSKSKEWLDPINKTL